MIVKRTTLVLLLGVASHYCASQNVEDISFHRISKGLLQHTITSIIQDERGFMWFGTQHGLNIYDGVKFSTFEDEQGGINGLSNRSIKHLLEDNKGRLWVGTFGGGLNMIDIIKGEVKSFTYEENNRSSISDDHVVSIYQDASGIIWVGTERRGLNRLDPSTFQFTRYLANENDPSGISGNWVTGITEDRYGNLWVSTWGGGLNLYDRANNRFIRFSHQSGDDLSLCDDRILRLYRGPSGNIWVGTAKGIQKLLYDQQGKYYFERLKVDHPRSESILSEKKVLSLLEDSQSNLWVGTEWGLVKVLPSGSARLFTNDPLDPLSLSSNSIWSLYEDNTGIIWIGTYFQGINKIDRFQRKFSHVSSGINRNNTLSHNLVSSLAEDPQGNIWIGTDGGGLNYWDREAKKYTHYLAGKDDIDLSSNSIVSLLVDDQDQLWVGTWEGGINVKKKGSKQFSQLRHNPSDKNSLSGNYIFDLYQDSKGRIWISSFFKGLDVYLPEENRFLHFDKNSTKGVNSIKIRTIYEDHLGYIWLGSEGFGANRLRFDDQLNITEAKYFMYDPKDSTSIGSNTIEAICQDSKGRLWFGTAGSGINRYNYQDESFIRIASQGSLASNLAYAIEEDDQGKLWISTNHGLTRYDPESHEFEVYDEVDGLQATEFFTGSSLKTREGELLFGGINGMNRFFPEEIETNPLEPPVYLTKFSVSNQHVSVGKNSPLKKHISKAEKISLKYFQNDFSFEFSALNYSQASKNKYLYKLEDYDQTWRDPSHIHKAVYTNVPPGEYTFRLKASNNDGIWSKNEVSLPITIKRPWWATYWAYTLYVVLVLLFLGTIIGTIFFRERLKTDLKLEHLELVKMQEVDELKSRFFANISHEFRTPLTLIMTPLKSLYADKNLKKYQNKFRMMIRNSERLLRLINQILDLSKLESGKAHLNAQNHDLVRFVTPLVYSFTSYAEKQYINYNLKFPDEPLWVSFDKDKLDKVLINLVSNAFKYTPEFGQIYFSVEKNKKNAILTVKDSGIGIPKDKIDLVFNRYYRVNDPSYEMDMGTGIGLALTKELVELHNGRIEVESEKGKGTTFKVYLPLGPKGKYRESGLATAAPRHIPEETIYGGEVSGLGDPGEAHQEETQTLPLVLIAEDNEEMKAYIGEFLETNYHTLEAANGNAAFELAVEKIPDIIISDVMMPGMDGFELCKKLKNDERTSHIPVIMLTAKASGTSKEKGLESGADHYVTKPFNMNLLELNIRNILKSRKVYKEAVLKNRAVNLDPKDIVISSTDESFLKKLVGIVEKNIANSDFQVEDMCREIGLSKIQLYRKLKGLIDQSANEFIRSIRLKRAAQLLKQKKLTIAEVTYQVGFNDLQYFRSCFKKQYGTTPSKFVSADAS